MRLLKIISEISEVIKKNTCLTRYTELVSHCITTSLCDTSVSRMHPYHSDTRNNMKVYVCTCTQTDWKNDMKLSRCEAMIGKLCVDLSLALRSARQPEATEGSMKYRDWLCGNAVSAAAISHRPLRWSGTTAVSSWRPRGIGTITMMVVVPAALLGK